jgi:hypothetical protein
LVEIDQIQSKPIEIDQNQPKSNNIEQDNLLPEFLGVPANL